VASATPPGVHRSSRNLVTVPGRSGATTVAHIAAKGAQADRQWQLLRRRRDTQLRSRRAADLRLPACPTPAARPAGAAGGRSGRVRAGHDGSAEAGCDDAHDRDGWDRGSGRMRRGCRMARGCAARGEGPLMIVPSGAVGVLVATRPVDFRDTVTQMRGAVRRARGDVFCSRCDDPR
jgi:hypothetical protein